MSFESPQKAAATNMIKSHEGPVRALDFLSEDIVVAVDKNGEMSVVDEKVKK